MPAAVRKAAQCAQADALLVARHSQRIRNARATGVARMTIAKRLKTRGGSPPTPAPAAPEKAQRKREEVLDRDGRWTVVGRQKRKVRPGLVVERASRRLVAGTLGSRGESTRRRARKQILLVQQVLGYLSRANSNRD